MWVIKLYKKEKFFMPLDSQTKDYLDQMAAWNLPPLSALSPEAVRAGGWWPSLGRDTLWSVPLMPMQPLKRDRRSAWCCSSLDECGSRPAWSCGSAATFRDARRVSLSML
jgi:hypothetical protein